MKKIISVALAAVMLLTLAVPAFAAEGCDCGNDPVIMVSGFGATTLVKTNEKGVDEVVFPPSTDCIINVLKENAKTFDIKNPASFLAGVVAGLLEPIRLNNDGSSYYDLKPIYSSVEDTSYDGFVKNGATAYIPYGDSDFLDMKTAAARLGGDHVFNFLFDWRHSGDELADEFLAYIEDVLEYTGHDKVDVYCLSQGSVCVAQYLYKYSDKGYIDNLLFDNPIFCGSDFVADLLNGKEGKYALNIDEILDLLENIIHVELDLSDILGVLPSSVIDPFVNNVIKVAAEDIIFPIALNSAAYLEMVPSDKLDQVINDYFSKEGNEVIVNQAMKVINGYMADIEGTLRNAIADGVNVSILSCSGFGLVTGTKAQSDAIVNLSSSCGAYCAPDGETFPEDYVQKKAGVYSISPDRTIDLSCGFLPERTWIINERYHGQGEWAPNSLALIESLLYTHDLKDAYSSYTFPQFMQSDDPGKDVSVTFDATNSLNNKTGANGTMTLKNTSKKYSLFVTGVKVTGAEEKSLIKRPLCLRPGQTVTVAVETDKASSGQITVTYRTIDFILSAKTRSFKYTVCDDYGGVVAEEQPEKAGFFATVLATIKTLVNKVLEFLKLK